MRLHVSLLAGVNVAFEEILVFGVCRPANNGSSLNLLSGLFSLVV